MVKDTDGQSIQYLDGFAWGVTPEGGTICLGTEPDIRRILANPREHPRNPTIAEVISVERQLIKQDINKTKKEQGRERAKLAERKKQAKTHSLNLKKARINKNRA